MKFSDTREIKNIFLFSSMKTLWCRTNLIMYHKESIVERFIVTFRLWNTQNSPHPTLPQKECTTLLFLYMYIRYIYFNFQCLWFNRQALMCTCCWTGLRLANKRCYQYIYGWFNTLTWLLFEIFGVFVILLLYIPVYWIFTQ